MGKNDWILPVLLLAGGAYWYFKMNGKATIDNLLGDLKGGGGSDFSFSGGGARVDVDLPPSAEGISNQVQSMLQKMGVHGSGESISRTRQVDTTGQAKQSQSHKQTSSVFYTIPRFGNL